MILPQLPLWTAFFLGCLKHLQATCSDLDNALINSFNEDDIHCVKKACSTYLRISLVTKSNTHIIHVIYCLNK